MSGCQPIVIYALLFTYLSYGIQSIKLTSAGWELQENLFCNVTLMRVLVRQECIDIHFFFCN